MMKENFFILKWSEEYLCNSICAGPLSEKDCQEKLKELMVQEIVSALHGRYCKEEAEKIYEFAETHDSVEVLEEYGVNLSVSSAGASVSDGNDYFDYYHIVNHNAGASGETESLPKGEDSLQSSDKIYTHDESSILIEMFEKILMEHNIRIPSPEDDERDPDDYGLYGSTYGDLMDDVENKIINILNRCKSGSPVIYGEYSGTI